ncbi:secreted RxLR effector protein 161-like [Lotus japonicus]|uniref:secreted RxLR effector protein 161-like n=1 Tax=Lotus japonicus TaxID=34305 RepID=UPI0025860A62|nr:secreted RxLR effector protein 161-like [Lotus japonicus]
MKEFDMTDMGSMNYFLGIEVIQKENGIFICQRRYALEVLKKYGMQESNMVATPIVPGSKLDKDSKGTKVDATFFKELVGSLFYLTSTRPDMMYITSLLSKYMSNPTKLHMQAAKRALRYLKGIVDYGLFYKHCTNIKLLGFTDSDYAGDVEDSKSTSGYVFMLSSAAISWSSKKQPIVTLSTT